MPNLERPRAMAVALALLLAVVGGLTSSAPAGADDRTRPVLLLHGWSVSSDTDCSGTFDRMIGQLQAEGFTGPFIKVGYYSGNTGCDVNLQDWGDVGDGTPFDELGQVFSQYVYSTFTSQGVTVDVVGYSMGGVVARAGIYGSGSGQGGFSPPIAVEDAVTLGSPHQGAAWYTNVCFWGQCAAMRPGSSQVAWLNGNGDPQGAGGTDWTVIGSDEDAVVPADSALSMSVPAARKARYGDVPHTGSGNYMGRTDVTSRAATALAVSGS